MQMLDDNKYRQNLEEATERLDFEGWTSLGNWLFFRNGKVYDLSAANLDQLEKIEREGLFLVAM